jgi:hypothetical protein
MIQLRLQITFPITNLEKSHSNRYHNLVSASGGMVDALASGASVLRDVEVRVFSRVP